jgi:hypothetical protein
MFPATTLNVVCTLLGMTDRSAIPQSRRMAGLVFARASSKFAQDEVLSQLDYFHCRSGTHIDFFCAGVTRGDKETAYRQQGENDLADPVIGGYKDVASKTSGWLYSEAAFCKFCAEVESRCKWEYKGGTYLVLLDAELAPKGGSRNEAKLDFSEVLAVNLEELKSSELIASVPEFFEKIIAYVKPSNVQNPRTTFGFSDAVFARAVSKLTFDAIVKLLPGFDAKGVKSIDLLTTRNLEAKDT